jgi:ribosomal protein S18 acetylase RimI-like enzyme
MVNAKDKEFLFIPCGLGDDDLISQISLLAKEIWVEYFTSIIGIDQVNYMLATLQSSEAIRQQIAEGYSYYLIAGQNNFVGYFSFRIDEMSNSVHLSKLHLLSAYRRCGIATDTLRFLHKKGMRNDCNKLWLTVNKNNSIAIAAYEAMGFSVTDSLTIDIGEGFEMNDYRMEKII